MLLACIIRVLRILFAFCGFADALSEALVSDIDQSAGSQIFVPGCNDARARFST